MAKFKIIKDTMLVGGTDHEDVYPVTSTQALYSHYVDGQGNLQVREKNGEPEKLEDRLEDHEADAQVLHQQTEKLAVNLSNNQNGKTLEITGTSNVCILTGSAAIDTYGDAASKRIYIQDMSKKVLKVGSTTVNGSIDPSGYNYTGSYTLPDTVGSYIATFTCEYNGTEKVASSVMYVNLRKYFGFADAAPTDPTTLNASDFSNSVGCTIAIPDNGTGFKHIYFAVPDEMSISRVVQPDALNAPLAITQIGTINRVIGSSTYIYKLYESNDTIDSSNSKRLTIS